MPDFLILGPPGVGKSTLINTFAGRDVATCGSDASGVTKEITPYAVSAGLSQQMTLHDVPGYGGPSGEPLKLSVALKNVMTDTRMNGILVCVGMDNIRFEMANHFITELVNMFIDGSEKWSKVIFVLTKENIAKRLPGVFPTREQAIASYRSAVRAKIPQCPADNVLCVGQRIDECMELAAAMEFLAPITPLPPPKQDVRMGEVFVGLLEKVWGMPKDVIVEELKKQGECFAMDCTVRVQAIGEVKMKDLKPGDMVQDKDSYTKFVGFFHINAKAPTKFVEIDVGSCCLRMTPSHLVMVVRGEKVCPVPAASVVVGEMLLCSDGRPQAVRNVGLTEACGYLAPLTASGTLFVNDVLVSCYLDVPGATQEFMHMMMAPIWLTGLELTPPDMAGALHWYPCVLQNLNEQFPWLLTSAQAGFNKLLA